LLNSGHNLKILDDGDIETIWESIFFALWYAEMGRGCEEIIAAVERACAASYRLTRVGLITVSKKWYGLDQYRIDKVSHLARHLLTVLLSHQVKLWLRSCRKSKKLGTQDIYCRQLLKRTLLDVAQSYGLCYFILEILAEEITKTLTSEYEKLDITVARFELKANLIVFIYKQTISFVARTHLDTRLLKTFDQYVIKKFLEDVLPNESQLTQILISLRMHQAFSSNAENPRNPSSGRCKAMLLRWSTVFQDVHEKCINSEYFPASTLPTKSSIQTRQPLSI